MDGTPRLCLLLAATMALVPGLAEAQEAEDAPDFITLSGNFALVSDYRFRGVSLSDEDLAVQGGITIATAPGFYLGTWASSIETFQGAEAEVDLVAGYGITVAAIDIDFGVTAFLFPGGRDTNYVEPYVSVGRSFGPLSTSLGVAYAPDQKNIGGRDSVYLYSDLSLALLDTPLALDGHVGFEDGAFGNEKVDWSVGLGGSFYGLDMAISYVDTSKAGSRTDATVVLSVGVSF